jgi:carbon monoxide dehydrogenase subunit G
MDLSGEYRIPASPERVWEALNDPAVLQGCIAGCKSLDRTSGNELAAVVHAKVGPVSAIFKGSVVLSDLDPPRAYTLTGQGQGGSAGFAKMSARVTLAQDGTDTRVRYSAKADIGGKLASIGSRLVQTVARKNVDDFFSAFARTLGGSGVPEAAPVSAEAPAMPGAPPSVRTEAGKALAALVRKLVPLWWIIVSASLGLVAGYLLGRMG